MQLFTNVRHVVPTINIASGPAERFPVTLSTLWMVSLPKNAPFVYSLTGRFLTGWCGGVLLPRCRLVVSFDVVLGDVLPVVCIAELLADLPDDFLAHNIADV